MIAAENIPFSALGRREPPDRGAADDETLQALELMLANRDERLSGEEPPSSTPDRLTVVRELLDRLDTLGPAGQRDLMGRVISLLAAETEAETTSLAGGNRRALCDQLERLRQEAGRPWPDAASFCQRADNLTAMLATPPAAPR